MTNKVGRPKKTIPIDSSIGNRIHKARTEAGYKTYKPFADRIGVSVSSIRNWEKGRFEPEYSFLEDIANECNVSVEWLKDGSISDIVENSKNILCNFNPIEHHLNIAVQNVLKYAESNLSFTLKSDDFNKFEKYMEASIKSSMEFYINNLNNEKDGE